MDERTLEEWLHELAGRDDPPETAPAADLARGRRRAARHRLAVGGAVLATATVLALGTLVVPGLGGGSAAGPAGGGGVTPTGADSTPPPAPGETEVPTVEPSPGAGDTAETEEAPVAGPDDPFAPPSRAEVEVLRALRRAVAGHLDPEGVHISRQEVRRPNFSGSGGADGWTLILQKIGWTNPGEDGLGLVMVEVSTGFGYDCGSHYPDGYGTTCTDETLAGLDVVRVSSPDEGEKLAYRRPDGYVTAIATDTLYGNNSLVPVGSIDVTDAQLAAVLADPALRIPGDPPPTTTETLSGAEVRDLVYAEVGRDVVVGPESWGGATLPSWSGGIRGPGGVVTELMVQEGIGNFEVEAPCEKWFSSRCATRTVDGRTVRIDHRRNKHGGGFDVTYDGAARTIWVRVDPDVSGATALTVDEAVALATAARFQG